MYMIMLVLDDPDLLDQLLKAWEAVGVRGATIIESTGIQRVRRVNIPMRYIFQSAGPVEEGHLTVFVIVESEAIVQACLKASESVTGDLDLPNSGVFAAWPLTVVKGLPLKPREG
jgi:hypothetical protein